MTRAARCGAIVATVNGGLDMRPFDKEHNRIARNKLAEEGYEVTPDELVKVRKSAFAKIRKMMKDAGYPCPGSDEELFLMMKAAGVGKKKK